MGKLTPLQQEFFEKLQYIQKKSVATAMTNYKRGMVIEELLYDVTYDVMCDIMVFIDGYMGELKLDVVERESRESVRMGIELHDLCEDFLIYAK